MKLVSPSALEIDDAWSIDRSSLGRVKLLPWGQVRNVYLLLF
jgi:hypothetical protein